MGRPRRRTPRHVAVGAPVAVAAALIAGGCGADSVPDPVASATVAATATAPQRGATATTPQRGATTTAPQRGATTTAPGAPSTTTSRGKGNGTATTTSRGTGKGTATTTVAVPPPSARRRTATTPAVKVPAARAKLGRTQRFSGTGDRVLGTLKLDRSTVVRWTVSGSSFEVRDGAGKLKLAGRARPARASPPRAATAR